MFLCLCYSFLLLFCESVPVHQLSFLLVVSSMTLVAKGFGFVGCCQRYCFFSQTCGCEEIGVWTSFGCFVVHHNRVSAKLRFFEKLDPVNHTYCTVLHCTLIIKLGYILAWFILSKLVFPNQFCSAEHLASSPFFSFLYSNNNKISFVTKSFNRF